MTAQPEYEPSADSRTMAKGLWDMWGLLCKITGEGPTRDHDLSELVTHVHALQNAVLSQAAARAYPGRYRALGLSLAATDG